MGHKNPCFRGLPGTGKLFTFEYATGFAAQKMYGSYKTGAYHYEEINMLKI